MTLIAFAFAMALIPFQSDEPGIFDLEARKRVACEAMKREALSTPPGSPERAQLQRVESELAALRALDPLQAEADAGEAIENGAPFIWVAGNIGAPVGVSGFEDNPRRPVPGLLVPRSSCVTQEDMERGMEYAERFNRTILDTFMRIRIGAGVPLETCGGASLEGNVVSDPQYAECLAELNYDRGDTSLIASETGAGVPGLAITFAEARRDFGVRTYLPIEHNSGVAILDRYDALYFAARYNLYLYHRDAKHNAQRLMNADIF